MKLQGKNADLAVPTSGKNLRQPWELRPPAGEGALGTHAGPPLHLLCGLDRAGKGSRSPSLLGTAVLDFGGCSHAALQLLSQEAEFANQSTGLEGSDGMSAQNRCFQALIYLNLQIPFLNTGIPDRLLCN